MVSTRRRSESGLPLYASTSVSAVQSTIPHPTFTLPLTPPATPPDFKFSTLSHMNQQYASSSSSSSSSTRRARLPCLDDSPLSLPTLMSDDEDSPNGSTGAITPPSIYVSEHSVPRIITDHEMLNAFSQETTPRHLQEGFERRSSHPLLSPQRPLSKKQLWPHIERDASPPTTPKGHPLSRSGSGYFGSKSLTPISKPHMGHSYKTSFSYLLRVPRRSRPFVILGFCVISFIAIHLLRGLQFLPNTSPSTMARRALPRLARTTVVPTGLPSISFQTRDEELAALISFITSTSANMLPQVDTSIPLDPSAILDFDPTHPHARDDLDLLKEEIHTLYPLILFGKMRDPWHREVKKMLAEYKIIPAPLIIEVDQRRDNSVLSATLARLLGTNELPLLTLFGKNMGSYHDVLGLRDAGELKSVLEAGGLSVKPAKKNKKTVKEKQREENERILGPRPIVDGI